MSHGLHRRASSPGDQHVQALSLISLCCHEACAAQRVTMSNESSTCQGITSRWEKSTNCQLQILIALNDAIFGVRVPFKGASQTAHHVSTALE